MKNIFINYKTNHEREHQGTRDEQTIIQQWKFLYKNRK